MPCSGRQSPRRHPRAARFASGPSSTCATPATAGRPFPCTGVGELRTLREVLTTSPDDLSRRALLIHIKPNDVTVAERLATVLAEHPAEQGARWMVYGSERPVQRVLERVPALRGLTGSSVKACMLRHLLLAWTGYAPSACRHTLVLLPVNWSWMVWGLPHRFVARLAEHDTDVFLVGPNDGRDWLGGIDSDAAMRAACADHYSGGVWTDRIEAARSACSSGLVHP